MKVSNGNILSCVRASIIFQRECSLVNVESLGCTNGFLLDAGAGLTSEADLCQLTGCTVRSASGVAFDVESDQVILNGCIARSSGTSFRTVSGALATSIVGCQSVLATTSHFTNGGSGTLVSGCAGIADQNGAIANKTADFSVSTSEKWLTLNKASTCVVTLPTASASAAREIWVKNEVAQLLNSASSNVVPKTGGAAGTAILPATDGAWACLVSDGTNWIIMSSGV